MSNTDKEKYESLIALLEKDLKTFLEDTRSFKSLHPKFVSVAVQWYAFLHTKTTINNIVNQ